MFVFSFRLCAVLVAAQVGVRVTLPHSYLVPSRRDETDAAMVLKCFFPGFYLLVRPESESESGDEGEEAAPEIADPQEASDKWVTV